MFALNKEIFAYQRTYFFTKQKSVYGEAAFMCERNYILYYTGFFSDISNYASII